MPLSSPSPARRARLAASTAAQHNAAADRYAARAPVAEARRRKHARQKVGRLLASLTDVEREELCALLEETA